MISSLSFNQDNSCLSVCTNSGFKLFNCGDPFGLFYQNNDSPLLKADLLFNTSLVALVSQRDNRKLSIYNTKRLSFICNLPYDSPILNVKLNKKRLLVQLEEKIFIYDMSNMKLIHSITTNPTPVSVCALSASSENCYLAYLPSNQGEVLIFDAENLLTVKIIEAHKNPVSVVAFSFDGSMVATSSDKGTVIRVFSIPSGTPIFQFRRGHYPARIHSISFSISNQFLCVSSQTDTIHIFKLDVNTAGATAGNFEIGNSGSFDSPTSPFLNNGVERKGPHKKLSVFETLMSPIQSAANVLLPLNISEMWDPQRDFAYARLPKHHSSSIMTSSNKLAIQTNGGSSGSSSQVSSHSLAGWSICAITESNLLVVATIEGNFYQYTIDLVNGGECVLRLDENIK